MAKTAQSAEYKKRCEDFRQMFIARRKELEMTQNDLSMKSGVSIESIRALEGGRSSNPSFLTAIKLLKALKIKIGELNKWTC